MRHLVVVFGDQLDLESTAFDGFDPEQDAVWMAEAAPEATYVWSTKARIVMFLAAMRHFRDALRTHGWTVHYRELETKAEDEPARLSDLLRATIEAEKPEKIIAVEPGEWRVWRGLEQTCEKAEVPLEVRVDRHFLSTMEDFRQHAHGRKSLRMEFFYREMRKKTGILMDGKDPVGGKWNYDHDNRGSFGKSGPPPLPHDPDFSPDAVTTEVIALVNAQFADHPGTVDDFAWPVDRPKARETLEHFIAERLPRFGEFQDAMWTGEPFLFHARLSAALNLKLLNPREVIAAAEKAYRDGQAPLAAVEGFIRQILGWREYVRGVYWLKMPEYLELNHLEADQSLPEFFWTGETELKCLQESIGQTLRYGYAHHIQRLMVTGLYTLLLGVDPREVHAWYLAVYVDAVEWVELPNTLGMSQFGDGGVMASKPYVATGKYIQRMSNFCAHCPKDPTKATGPDACPFTTLYWDFLGRNEALLRGNPRMSMQLRNLDRLDDERRAEIRKAAELVRRDPAQTG